MAPTSIPSDEVFKAAWQPYVLALGRVAHAWNHLHESLGQVFAELLGCGNGIALAIWYSTHSDRLQRDMLRAAIVAAPEDHKISKIPAARDDLLWLVEEANKVGNKRNDAVHAPCSMAIVGKEIGIIPAYFHGNPRAESLKDKDILKEFAWYETWAGTLNTFARDIATGLSWHQQQRSWPDRPQRPILGQRQNQTE